MTNLQVSSPGAMGMYPWIDRVNNYYGILAHMNQTLDQAGYESSVVGTKVQPFIISALLNVSLLNFSVNPH